VSPKLRPFYVGVRANALGTYDDDKGYFLDSGQINQLGYNPKSQTDYSAVLGWVLNDFVRIRAEYTRRDIDMVNGTTPGIRGLSKKMDLYAVEVGASF
jgi:hypothetical protein